MNKQARKSVTHNKSDPNHNIEDLDGQQQEELDNSHSKKKRFAKIQILILYIEPAIQIFSSKSQNYRNEQRIRRMKRYFKIGYIPEHIYQKILQSYSDTINDKEYYKKTFQMIGFGQQTPVFARPESESIRNEIIRYLNKYFCIKSHYEFEAFQSERITFQTPLANGDSDMFTQEVIVNLGDAKKGVNHQDTDDQYSFLFTILIVAKQGSSIATLALRGEKNKLWLV